MNKEQTKVDQANKEKRLILEVAIRFVNSFTEEERQEILKIFYRALSRENEKRDEDEYDWENN